MLQYNYPYTVLRAQMSSEAGLWQQVYEILKVADVAKV